jgi:hypothetical protein
MVRSDVIGVLCVIGVLWIVMAVELLVRGLVNLLTWEVRRGLLRFGP